MKGNAGGTSRPKSSVVDDGCAGVTGPAAVELIRFAVLEGDRRDSEATKVDYVK
jgi:hypothetical protein